MSWQKFEEDAQQYIKKKINVKDIEVKFDGGSDSNSGDIRIIKKNKNLFINFKIIQKFYRNNYTFKKFEK